MLKMYLSIPIRYCMQAHLIETSLNTHNILVLNPCHIMPENCSAEDIPRAIASSCWQMINDSSAVILFADYYGRDCAAEIGYAIAQNKPVFPVFFQEPASFLNSDWMIKFFLESTSSSINMLVAKIQKRFPNLVRATMTRDQIPRI